MKEFEIYCKKTDGFDELFFSCYEKDNMENTIIYLQNRTDVLEIEVYYNWELIYEWEKEEVW